MKITKIVCGLLCIIMLLSVLAGCVKKTPDEGGESDSNGEIEESYETDEYGQRIEKTGIPDELDYGGAEVIIATRSATNFRREFGVDNSSSALDQRITKRNQKVEQELGIKLKIQADFDHESDVSAPNDIFAYVDKQYKAGQDSYDILGTYAAYAALPGIRQYLVNLYDDRLTYLDLSKSYYNQSYIEAATLHDQLYYVVGDLNLSVYDRISVNFVNLDALEVAGVTPNEFYKLVEDGLWTVEKMTEIVTDAGWVDNDQSVTKTNLDSYGLAWNYGVSSTDAYQAAFNMYLIKKDDSGSLSFDVENNLTKIENAYEKLAGMYALQQSYRGAASENLAIFTAGRSVFYTSVLSLNDTDTKAVRDVKFDYAIAPLPKLEVDPAVKYQTMPIDTYNAMIVLDNKDDKQLEITSATLELLNAKSYSDVRPYYIEKMLKGRYVDGGNSVTMLETILDGISFRTEWIYCQQTGYIASYIWRHVFNKEFADTPTDSSPTTQWEEYGSSAESDLYDLDEFFRASIDG